MDDLSVVHAINMKRLLTDDTVSRPYPLAFNERTKMILPQQNNKLQDDLYELEKFVEKKEMRIKESKTYVMKLNFSRKFDFCTRDSNEGFF